MNGFGIYLGTCDRYPSDTVVCINALNKQSILKYINQFHTRKTFKQFTAIHIDCPCGKTCEFKADEDIPENSIQCDCGCYLIKYKQNKDDVILDVEGSRLEHVIYELERFKSQLEQLVD